MKKGIQLDEVLYEMKMAITAKTEVKD